MESKQQTSLKSQLLEAHMKRYDDYHLYLVERLMSLLDYDRWWDRGRLHAHPDQMRQELLRLSANAIDALCNAFLHLRGQLLLAGYNLGGFKTTIKSSESLRTLLEDPYFDLRVLMYNTQLTNDPLVRDFPTEAAKDVLCQIDYSTALRAGWSEVRQERVLAELKRLSLVCLFSLYEALLSERDYWFGGFEINGLQVLTRPHNDALTAARELIL
jgi:hypothetical protein